jgi:hypothetical protein
VWEPPYDREGQPITADDPNPNTPLGQYENEIRFTWGLKGSPYQRRAARAFFGVLGVIVVAIAAVAIIYAAA